MHCAPSLSIVFYQQLYPKESQYACMLACMNACMCVFVSTYERLYACTHTCTYTRACSAICRACVSTQLTQSRVRSTNCRLCHCWHRPRRTNASKNSPRLRPRGSTQVRTPTATLSHAISRIEPALTITRTPWLTPSHAPGQFRSRASQAHAPAWLETFPHFLRASASTRTCPWPLGSACRSVSTCWI